MRERIGLFSGTFDPVHRGHEAIVRSFLKCQLFDQLMVLVTPDPPHKSGSVFAPFHDRIAMVSMAFTSCSNVYVSDLEHSLPQPNYSLQTIRAVRQQNPDAKLFFCLGGDSLKDFTRWYGPDKILEEVTLVVASRPEEDTAALDARNLRNDADTTSADAEQEVESFNQAGDLWGRILEKTIFVDHKPVSISSTQIRNQCALDVSHRQDPWLRDVLHPDVFAFIRSKRLYGYS